MKYYIAAPFGNYLHKPDMYSVMGTYTLQPRPGLLKQILKTLRYNFHYNGWTNKLGLRNPGIETAINKYYQNPSRRIISLYGFNKGEWETLAKYTRGMKQELNISCPNVENKFHNTGCPVELFPDAILKMSPLTTEEEIVMYMERGVRRWHFSNTLPVSQGGLSGKTLMQYNRKLIKFTLSEDKRAKIIGGGGVTSMSDVRFYKDLGCIGVSLGSVCMLAFGLRRFKVMDE